MTTNYLSDIYLSWPEVQRITGNKSRTTIWRWIRDKTFPSSYQTGANSVSWKASEIQEWMDSRKKGGGDVGTGAAYDYPNPIELPLK